VRGPTSARSAMRHARLIALIVGASRDPRFTRLRAVLDPAHLLDPLSLSTPGSVLMSVEALAGGWIFDTFDAYSWLFIGSFAVGLGAVAIALAFPPLPRERLQPA
jgi:hypothetical protein